MKILLFHAGRFYYRPREKAVKDADQLDNGLVTPQADLENVLVAFTTIEEGDEKLDREDIKLVADDLIQVFNKLRASAIIIYPYAHLSSSLAPPAVAKSILRRLYSTIAQIIDKKKVVLAPFGWYKEFYLHCLGHPLAELSRSYKPRKEIKAAKIEKQFYVLDLDGSVYSPEEFLNKSDRDFRILIEKEALGRELGEVETQITRLCAKFGFEWEPFSDYGHMRYEPHAAFIIEAVSAYAWSLARKLSIPVLKVKGTNMFDMAQQPVYEHAKLFGDRLYTLNVEGKKKVVLRYAACHQQFAMLKDYVLSYRDLPLGMFEVADSYRLEQSGEVTLCFRLRKFYMPDLHILVKNLEEAMKIAFSLQKIIHEEAAKYNQRYVAVYNVTEDFWREHRDELLELVKRDGRPALIALYPSGIYYWVVNVEYHIIDSAGRPREIATFQFDVGNAKRFGIKYVDENGEEKYPIIIHTALIGSVERYIYMVFDKAVKDEAKGETPYIPTWLSPIEVRLIPVDPSSKEQMDYTSKVAEILEEYSIRYDIDERQLSLGRRIRDAAREWIPYIAVIGDREVQTGTLNVTIRKTNDRIALKPKELIDKIVEETKSYPRLQSTLPKYVGQRPSLIYLEKPLKT